MGKKAIILINLTGKIGGAEKRFFSAFKHFKQEDHITLFLNRNLADTFGEDANLFQNKVVILDVDALFSRKKTPKYIGGINIHSNEPISRSNKILGRTKTVIKLALAWIHFVLSILPHLLASKFTTVYGVWTGGIWVWPFKYIFRFKFCYAYMDSNYDSLSKSWHRLFDSEYWALRNADIVDCLSPKIAKDLPGLVNLRKKTKISITPNSFIDYTNYFPVYPKKNQIVFSSRLYPQKNPLLLLEAMYLLQKSGRLNKDYNVIIIGEGPMKTKLEKYINEKQLMNINLFGFTLHPYKILQKSRIFLSLQSNDNYPSQSLIEAMACGNAIIATNTGCTNLLITEKEGILINKNILSTASALEYLINNPKVCKTMGENARDKVINTHTVEKFIDYLKTIMD